MKKSWLIFFMWILVSVALLAVSTPRKTIKPPALSNLQMAPPKPDLVVNNCRFEIQGVNVKAYVTLLNSGNAAAVFQDGQTMAELATGGKTYKSKALAGGFYLGAGLTVERMVTFPSPLPGTYPATWTADPAHVIDEKSPANNAANCQLSIPDTPKPDLVIPNLSVQPSSGPPSTVFTILITVANQGDADSPGSSLHIPTAWLDGSVYDCSGLRPNVSLAVGKSYTFTYKSKYPLAPGTHVFTANVDRMNLLAEKNENNNSSSPFTIVVTQ